MKLDIKKFTQKLLDRYEQLQIHESSLKPTT